MPTHQEASIGYAVDSEAALSERMKTLQRNLLADLHEGFESTLGIPIPTAGEAEILEMDVAIKYAADAKSGEFLSGARALVNAAFSGDRSVVATKALDVARVALSSIFDGNTSVKLGVHGDSAKILLDSTVYVAAAYASTAPCLASEWSTDGDFYVSQYVFVVLPVRDPGVRALLFLETV